jgi:hypothetical protein
MTKLIIFFQLKATDRHLFLFAIVVILIVRLGLSLLTFQHFLTLYEKLREYQKKRGCSPMLHPERIGWAVDAAGQYVPGAKCLAKALAGQLLLGHWGRPSKVRMGIVKDGSNFVKGHAWLESDGIIIIGGRVDLSQFAESVPLGNKIKKCCQSSAIL